METGSDRKCCREADFLPAQVSARRKSNYLFSSSLLFLSVSNDLSVYTQASLVAQMVKNLSMQETQETHVRSLRQEDALE